MAQTDVERKLEIALSQLHGICSACKHYSAYHNQGACKICKYEKARMSDEVKDNWEWNYGEKV